jgi:hypothetical protein
MKTLAGIPQHQRNANLAKEMCVRVGIPHKGGALAFHAFNQDYPAMVSASAFWNPRQAKFVIPEYSDLWEIDFALDSAGFTAMAGWQAKGTQPGMAGIFPWTCAQYVELASMVSPAWWSQPDCCAEPQIARDAAEVERRVNITATLLEGTLRQVFAWQEELARTCNANVVANLLKPPVPVLQGWTVDQYLRSLDLMVEVWQRWEPWIDSPALIGLGSVCRRPLTHPEHGLYAILAGLEGRLPKGARLHLFGVKGDCLSEISNMPWIASTDSMAYDFGARVQAFKERRSNTMAHRCEAMSRWMQTATARSSAIAP